MSSAENGTISQLEGQSPAAQGWRARVIIFIVAAAILVCAFLWEHPPGGELTRDVIKDLGVVVAGLLVVDIVRYLAGGDPVTEDIKKIRQGLTALNVLTRSAQEAGIREIGSRMSRLKFSLTTYANQSTSAIDICGISLQLLQQEGIFKALQNAALRPKVIVRILLSHPENEFLRGSNDPDSLASVSADVIRILNKLKPIAAVNPERFQVRLLTKSTMLMSLLRCDEDMQVTPYLISATTLDSPRFRIQGKGTPLFQVYLKEFEYMFNSGKSI